MWYALDVSVLLVVDAGVILTRTAVQLLAKVLAAYYTRTQWRYIDVNVVYLQPVLAIAPLRPLFARPLCTPALATVFCV